MWKFKSLTGRDKWLFLLTIGVILCILAFPVGNGALSVKKTSGSVTERETRGEIFAMNSASSGNSSVRTALHSAKMGARVASFMDSM